MNTLQLSRPNNHEQSKTTSSTALQPGRETSRTAASLAVSTLHHDWNLHDLWTSSSEDSWSPETAFHEAVLFCKKELKKDKSWQRLWLNGLTTSDSLRAAIEDAQRKYAPSPRCDGKGARKSRLQSFWKSVASKVVFYSKVLDVLVQHHPEYVSLAWGALKFLFVVTINHEELVTKISDAFCEIGSVLEEIEARIRLYPTTRMKAIISRLYCYIVDFCMKAAKWCTRNKISKAILSVTRPWALEYEGLLSQIRQESERLRQWSNVALSAEIRALHTAILHSPLENMAGAFAGVSGVQTSSPSQPQPLFTLDNFQRYLTSKAPDPKESLRVGTALRRRRQSRGSDTFLSPKVLSSLQAWAAEKNSSVLLLDALLSARNATRDFAFGLINLAQTENLPVIWCINTLGSDTKELVSSIDIVKSLIFQLLQYVPQSVLQSTKLNDGHLSQSDSLEEWLKILRIFLGKVQRLLVVLDATSELAKGMEELSHFWQEIVADVCSSGIKVVVISNKQFSSGIFSTSSENGSSNTISLGKETKPNSPGRKQRVPQRAASRLSPKRRKEPDFLKPLLLPYLGEAS